jgi:Cytochrome C'
MPDVRTFLWRLALAAVAGLGASCASQQLATKPCAVAQAVPSIPLPRVDETKPRDYPGIHNAVAFHPGFVSGSAPDSDAGFDTLAAMGVKTIISVDGAEPDVARASARGIRYIHLPIGYNGFDEDRKLQLVRATRDGMADGPVFIHCHHGKHRSAGAAATIAASLGWESPETGVERMRVSGTAPDYTGLFTCARNAVPLMALAIDGVSPDFPSVWKPSSFVKGMVEIDEAIEHLKTIEAAGWVTPAHHPDLIPAAEAGRLADLHRILAQSDHSKRQRADFVALMLEANRRAQALEDSLTNGVSEAATLSAQFGTINASCKDCHAKYRD